MLLVTHGNSVKLRFIYKATVIVFVIVSAPDSISFASSGAYEIIETDVVISKLICFHESSPTSKNQQVFWWLGVIEGKTYVRPVCIITGWGKHPKKVPYPDTKIKQYLAIDSAIFL